VAEPEVAGLRAGDVEPVRGLAVLGGIQARHLVGHADRLALRDRHPGDDHVLEREPAGIDPSCSAGQRRGPRANVLLSPARTSRTAWTVNAG
jgi:hypothetical protein